MRRALLPLLLLVPACGGGSSGSAPIPTPVGKATLPDFPFVETDAVAVDAAHLDDEATLHCSERGAADAVLFLLEDLPLGAVDGLCEAGVAELAEEAPPEARFGDLYLSGYFGGLWLRDALEPAAAEAIKDAIPPTPFEEFVLLALAGLAADGLALARSEDDAKVVDAARASLPLLGLLFGYNRGYLEATLENPPPGVPPPDAPLACAGLLDCSRPGVTLATLDRFRAAFAKIANPPTDRWREVADVLAENVGPSIPLGREVWEGILAGRDIDAEAYDALLEVSTGYLLVTEAAILAAATAYAEEDAEGGRCGALVSGGLLLWSGSYFLGLGSAAPTGTFPTVACE